MTKRKPYPIKFFDFTDERLSIVKAGDGYYVELFDDRLDLDQVEKIADWFTRAAEWIRNKR